MPNMLQAIPDQLQGMGVDPMAQQLPVPEKKPEKAPKYSEDQLKDLSLYLTDLYRQFQGSTARQRNMEDVEQSRKCYAQDLEVTSHPWEGASNLISPLTTIAVDQMEPRFVNAIIGREPIIKATHHPPLSSIDDAEAVTKFDNFVLQKELKVFKLTSRTVHRAMIDGTVFVVLSWALKERKQRDVLVDQQTHLPQVDGGEYLTQDVNKRYYDGPQAELVLTDYVYMPDDVEDDEWEDAPVIREINSYTMASLKRKAAKEDGWMLPDKDELKTEIVDQVEQSSMDKEQDVNRDHYSVMPEKYKPIPCIEAYLNWDMKDEGEDEALIVTMTVQGHKILRIRKQIDLIDTNIKLIRRIRFRPEEGSSWGKPMYSLIKGIQLGLDGICNRFINSADIAATPWGLYKRTFGNSQADIVIAPGAMNEVDDPNSVVFPNVPIKLEVFTAIIMQYISFYERLTNVMDFSQRSPSQMAGPGKAGSTATGTLAVLQEGKISQEYSGKTMHEQYLDLFIKVHDLCASNMPVELQVAALGHPISKYTMSKQYDFELSGSDVMSNRFIARKENEDFMTTLRNMPGAANLIDPMWMLKQVLYNYDKNPEEVINPELAAVVNKYLQEKAAAAEMEQKMGIPKEMAEQAAKQGITPQGAKHMIHGIGEKLGELAGPGEGGVQQ